MYGMVKAALERFTTGLAAEVWEANVAVNSLSPSRVVPTPGTVFHHLVRPDDPNQVVEQPEVIAEAALALCSRPPAGGAGDWGPVKPAPKSDPAGARDCFLLGGRRDMRRASAGSLPHCAGPGRTMGAVGRYGTCL